LSSLRQSVPLQDLADGQTCLKGDWAGAKFSPERKQVCKDSLDWGKTKRASNRFEALMAYHHITEAQQYIQGLGLAPVNAERQNVIANPIPDDNSFYLPSADEIQLGTGGVDDGEDADVIVHEYGHAVQDAQAPDAFRAGGNQVGAMGEGFGDYLAAAYSTEKAGPDPEWTPCIMEWDATSYDDRSTPPPGICLRRADDPSSRQQQLNQCGTAQDIHCMGQIWSSALLDLRTELGLDAESDSVADTLVLASHFLLPDDPSFEEAAGAIIDADSTIYGGTHCVALGTEFEDRGFGQFVAAC
ncbi:MAG: M36 family metallopeptidase, partial [Chloroflexota bacterium]|nr:M36 family metallopeptidase [Chloroflexota bacterium]